MPARFRRSGRQALCRLRALPLLLFLLAVQAAGLDTLWLVRELARKGCAGMARE